MIVHVLLGAQAVLICGVLVLPQDFIKAHAHIVYLLHYSLFLPFLFASRDRCAFLFCPSFLVVSYICISFIIGGFAFSKGYVLLPEDLIDYHQWDHFAFATAYVMLCNMFALAAYFVSHRKWPAQQVRHVGGSLRRYKPQLMAGFIVLSVAVALKVSLAALGGRTDLAAAVRSFGMLAIAITMVKARFRYRFFVYIAFLLLLAAAEYMNRRYVVMLVVSLLFIEAAHLRDVRFSLKPVLLCVVVLVAAAFLQVTMTIARGVDGFKGSYWQTFSRMGSFTGLDNVFSFSLAQTEGPSLFFHGNNAIHYILWDESRLSYGGTLSKVFLVGVPRSVWPEKPESLSLAYMAIWKPTLRKRGCSAAVMLYSEYFWNLHVFGVLCVFPVFYFLNHVFFFWLTRLRAGNLWPFVYLGVGYSAFLTYARGQGFETMAIQVALAFAVQLVLFNPLIRLRPHRRATACTVSASGFVRGGIEAI